MRIKEMITQYNELTLQQLLVISFTGNIRGQRMGI